MPFLEYQRLIIAYHGCDQAVADAALRGVELKKSDNDYDWLGTGIYFWEHGPARALEWAEFMASRKKVKTPAVIGALIQLGHCFDLLDVRLTENLRLLYPEFEKAIAASGKPLPSNDSARKLHRLDCAFLNWAIPLIEDERGVKFQTVRGVFIEGEAIYSTAQIFAKSHIQISVRDSSAIMGYFHPAAVDKL
jgi:hypothetical protein